MHHPLNDSPGARHLGVVDATGRVVATSSFYTVPCRQRLDAAPAVRRTSAWTAVLAEAIRRLQATDAVLPWAGARDTALPFYERFGFKVVGERPNGDRDQAPHHTIELELDKMHRSR